MIRTCLIAIGLVFLASCQNADFAPIYDALAELSDLEPADLMRDDDVVNDSS